MAEGADFSGKVIHLMGGFAAAFQSILPSFHPIDLCVGVAVAVALRLAVYIKGKNAKKFRKNMNDFDTWIFFKWIFKTFCAVLIVTNT